MYNSQLVTERIKQVTKEKNVSMSQLNEICGLSKNAISSAGKSQEGMKAKNLYMIAEYLDVSVDYLLGRTEESSVYTNNENSFNVGNNSTQTVGNYNNISTNKSNDISDDAREFDNTLKSLSYKERIKFLSRVYELEEEVKKKEV